MIKTGKSTTKPATLRLGNAQVEVLIEPDPWPLGASAACSLCGELTDMDPNSLPYAADENSHGIAFAVGRAACHLEQQHGIYGAWS